MTELVLSGENLKRKPDVLTSYHKDRLEERRKLKLELNLEQQLKKIEDLHENVCKLQEKFYGHGELIVQSDGNMNPNYEQMISNKVTIGLLHDIVNEYISDEKKKIGDLEERFEKLEEKITPPADSIDLTDDEDQTCRKKRKLDDPKLEKRVEDLEERLSKLEEKATQKPPEGKTIVDEGELPSLEIQKETEESLQSFRKHTERSAIQKAYQERFNANPNLDTARAADALIKGRSDIYPGCKIWFYKKTLRKPGVIKKVNIVKAIVTMANSQGIQAEYDIPFTMLGLREVW